MDLPSDLVESIDVCRSILQQNSFGHLVLRPRKRLLLALGPYSVGERARAVPSVGHRRRVALACATADKVVPLWERRLLGDSRPKLMIGLARAYARGEISEEAAREENSRFMTELEDMLEEEVGNVEYAGWAAVAAVVVAGCDEDLSEPDSDLDDLDVEVTSWSTAYAASVAYANGAPGQPGSDVSHRREFWNWWLDEAVPAAYGQEVGEEKR
jgi:Immunity protein Imm5